jgi:hypothetical protein
LCFQSCCFSLSKIFDGIAFWLHLLSFRLSRFRLLFTLDQTRRESFNFAACYAFACTGSFSIQSLDYCVDFFCLISGHCGENYPSIFLQVRSTDPETSHWYALTHRLPWSCWLISFAVNLFSWSYSCCLCL